MNSKILEMIGLSKIDPAIYIIVLLVICIGLMISIIVTNSKLKKIAESYNKFMAGKDGKSLEDMVTKKFNEIEQLIDADRKKTKHLQNIYENLKLTYQKTGIIKYDAFNEMGGKLSFALALLDKNNNGFVINAMHSREGCYTYIKEIIKGESYISLGEEERKALDKALGNDFEEQ